MDTIGNTIIQGNLQAMTQSFEVFNTRTLFPDIFFIDLSVNQTATNNFCTQMSTTNASVNLPNLLSKVRSCTINVASSVSTNNKIQSFSASGMNPYIFGSASSASVTPSIITFFINVFQSNPLPNVTRIDLNPNASDTYKLNLISFLQNVYFNILTYINKTITSSQSTDFMVPVPSIVMTNSFITSLLTYIENNVYNYVYSTNNDIDSYINNLYDGAYSYFGSMGGNFTSSHFNLFFVVFLPYFYFLYIYSLLPSATLSATNHGSRDGIIRRWSILAFYKFFMYMFYSVYKVSALYDPGNQYTSQLRQILDMNISSLFDQDTNDAMSSNAVDSLNSSTKQNMQNMSSLQSNNQKIVMNRSNIGNILTYQAQADIDLKHAKMVKMIWLIFVIVYISMIPIVYFFLQKHVEYFFIGSLVLAIILTIVGMVAVVKNF